VKRKKNIGLLRVLLSERKSLIEGKESPVLDYEFFHNYFNGDCEKYLRYVMDNNIAEDKRELYDLTDSIGCESVYMKMMYEKNPESVINQIKEIFRYDIVDDNRLLLDKKDLADFLRPDYLANILADFGLFEDWYPEFENDEIENALNDEEKNKLSKMMGKESFDFDDLEDTDLLGELKNTYLWAYRQASEDEVYERVMKDIKNYFQTDDVKFDEDSKGNHLLSIKIDKFLKDIVHDYYTNGIYEDFDVFAECSNFVCFLSEMIDYDGDRYTTIDSVSLDYFWPDSRKVEELFHEYFDQEIG
jgi:hypothetical protein